ncbi:MAG: YggS family pyridoxal phosphate-dependent enzyme [Microthrixaceae bacterium]
MIEGALEELTGRIAERKAALEARISNLTDREVTVVAVTKGHPPEVALAALRAGFVHLGENYAQELAGKARFVHESDPDAVPSWHFVGRLQSNKVRLIAPYVTLWQTVDRSSLVGEIAKRSPGADVLVQVDLAGLTGRGGVQRGDLDALVSAAGSAGLRVQGLMGVGVPDDLSATAEAFKWLESERARLGLEEVSMGMSGDLEAALAAGATIVRIGTDLFGERVRTPR